MSSSTLLRSSTSLFLFVAAAGYTGATSGNELFSETFSTDTATAGTTYNPPFTFSNGGGGAAEVTGGLLYLNNPGNGNTTHTFTRSGFVGEQRISARVGASASNGSYNVGLTIGENNITFHPGFAAGGAFRVDGPGGFSNTNMGWVPANGDLHQFDVDVFPSLGLFRLTVIDSNNPANVFQRSFVNPDSVGSSFGFRRSGPTTGDGRFDDLTVTAPSPGSPALTLNTLAAHPFATDTANTAAFHAAYPEFNTNIPTGSITTTSGVATLTTTANDFSYATRDGFTGELVISALVGADNSNGSYNVGLTVGDNDIVFHPGFSGAAFRVEGPNGFSNTDVGFTPDNDTLHQLIVHAFDDGLMEITLIDGDDDQNIFHTSIFDPNWSGYDELERQIGFRAAGPGAVAFFQDLTIQNLTPATAVAEPASVAIWSLVGTGALFWWFQRRKEK